MSDPPFDADDEANTPLTPEGRQSLIPTYITTRAELNEAEQENIAEADRWAFSRKRGDVVDVDFLTALHRRMLRKVWRWAGVQRTTELNIGVAPPAIAVDLHALVGDVRYWIDHKTFPRDEIAVRFHHRLVAIHPFPNGNGRHARLAADLLIVQLGGQRFSWGRANLVEAAKTRSDYVRALQAADAHDIAPLVAFARS
ncbi:MAG: mobile mystery protein B [Phenylobacterium sp.]|uniref:mobile mystery protein B n=1 Tax=Phenylobacterium sp. TaxID=1871053 RepID=UPI001B674CF0|nr:mobile mystery protein B [Phenylobacterium sp.]MBP7818343.1 mobile mystery protein B [Phenylobacterium sp.]